MARYGGFAEMSKAEHAVVCKKSTAARIRAAQLKARSVARRDLDTYGHTLSTFNQGVLSGRALILLRLKRFIKEMEKD